MKLAKRSVKGTVLALGSSVVFTCAILASLATEHATTTTTVRSSASPDQVTGTISPSTSEVAGGPLALKAASGSIQLTSAGAGPANDDVYIDSAPAAVGSSGLWVWLESQRTTIVRHIGKGGAVISSFSIGDPNHLGILTTSFAAAMTVDASGVWIGANETLLHLNPSNGSVSRINLPSVPLNAAAQSYGPPQVSATAPIVALAGGDSARMLAVVRMRAATVEFIQENSGAITSIQLPSLGDARDVAWNNSGALAIAMDDFVSHTPDEILIDRSGQLTSVHAGALFVAADGDGFISGNDSLEVIGASDVDTVVPGSRSASLGLVVGGLASATATGDIVAPSRSGFVVVSPNGSVVAQESIGTVTVPRSGLHVSGVQPTTDLPGALSPSVTLPIAPEAVRVDSSGTAWIVDERGVLSNVPLPG
jgi:hypothetical protein